MEEIMKAARIYVLLSTTLVAFIMRLNTWFDQEYVTIYIILYLKLWILRTLERYAGCIMNMRYSSLGHELQVQMMFRRKQQAVSFLFSSLSKELCFFINIVKMIISSRAISIYLYPVYNQEISTNFIAFRYYNMPSKLVIENAQHFVEVNMLTTLLHLIGFLSSLYPLQFIGKVKKCNNGYVWIACRPRVL